jgi:hypothetical protein
MYEHGLAKCKVSDCYQKERPGVTSSSSRARSHSAAQHVRNVVSTCLFVKASGRSASIILTTRP